MEIKIREKIFLNGRFGAIKKIETLYQRISKKLYVERGADLGDSESIPYENTKQCRSDALEFEHRQAQAIAEAQKMHNLKMI